MYHVTSRGDRREPIFEGDADRELLLGVVAQGLERFHAVALAYCLMGNHYHFVLHTREANLSLLMRHVNGVYTQAFNRRHGKVGHLFQGRFKAILVDTDGYLLQLCRYVELNPVRAGMVQQVHDWPWSSFGAHVGAQPAPAWLDVPAVRAHVLGRCIESAADDQRAREAYAAWVQAGLQVRLWDEALNQQMYLGNDAFVERMQARASAKDLASTQVPRPHRKPPRDVNHWLAHDGPRDEVLRRVHVEGGISMTALASSLGLSVARVSQLIAKAEARRRAGDV